jgi:hypothetical protein
VNGLLLDKESHKELASQMWDYFEKNNLNRIVFQAFFRRFVEAGCVNISLVTDADQSLAKRFGVVCKKLGDAPTLFKKLDVNGNGLVTFQEFLEGCQKNRLGLSDQEIEQLYLMMVNKQNDPDSFSVKGITYKDMISFLHRDRQPQLVHKAFQ